MKIKRMTTLAQQKLVHALPEQLRRQRPNSKGWPVADGRDKTVMWQPTCWPSGENVSRAAQKLLQR